MGQVQPQCCHDVLGRDAHIASAIVGPMLHTSDTQPVQPWLTLSSASQRKPWTTMSCAMLPADFSMENTDDMLEYILTLYTLQLVQLRFKAPEKEQPVQWCILRSFHAHAACWRHRMSLEWCVQVMSRGAETYQSSMQLLFQHALSAMRKEISTNMMIAQRGQLLQQALAAFIVCGNPKYLSQLLSIENFNAHLEEQGGSASAVLAQSIIDASTVKGPGITPGKLHVQAVQLVWEQMLKVGEEMAAVLSAQSPSSDQHPTCAPLIYEQN